MRLTSTIATAPLRISNTTGGQSFLGHRGGAIGAGSPVGEQILDSANRGTQLAIIGAGAAGLAAGYEMMKLGLQPVFFEMQSDPGHQDYVRPLGRGFSWDFTSSGNPTDGGGFTSWFPQVVQGPGPTPDNQPRFPLGRQIADFGAMRYPATHIALHTYVDDMFVASGDYYYGSSAMPCVSNMWAPFRDPRVYDSFNRESNPCGAPDDLDQLVYPTVCYIAGVAPPDQMSTSCRAFYRVEAGSRLGDLNEGARNVVFAYFNLISVSRATDRREAPATFAKS